MAIIDWSILVFFTLFIFFITIKLKKYTKSVADFLVANRCAGRYLLSVSQGASALGAVSFVAWFEMYYKAGFTPAFWRFLTVPLGLLIALSGYVIYRYRETRAMTMAQFFEMRYSRRFRIFCGILAWVCGVINMGIFPAVTAKFFIYFCGLPHYFEVLGIQISTFVLIMFIELSIGLFLTFFGGMVVVMLTDFFQGIFCSIVFLLTLLVLFFIFDWNQIIQTVKAVPAENSMINPFNATKTEGFNLWFFLMQTFLTIYGIRAWQGAQGYNGAAKNAHEAKMSGIIGVWRTQTLYVLAIMLPICIFTFLTHPEFSDKAGTVHQIINSISDSTIRSQMTVPVGLAHILPVGIMGLFAASMFASAITTDDTYLHSWGSIFIQDVILPFRKQGFSPKQHIWLLRFSILFVAVFVFFFSLFFKQNDYIMMYMQITGALYLGGAGAVIVGGLYWKRGSTAAAWAAMISGGGIAFSGILLQQIWSSAHPVIISWFPNWQFLVQNSEKFPYNGMQINFFAAIFALTVYIVVSLWGWLIQKKCPFNLEKMLHRGQYAIEGEHMEKSALPPTGFKALLPDKEFTKTDRLLYFALLIWSFGWSGFLIIVTAIHFIWGTSDGFWIGFWSFDIMLGAGLGIVTTIWFLIGGFRDFRELLKTIKSKVVDASDDGRVLNKN